MAAGDAIIVKGDNIELQGTGSSALSHGSYVELSTAVTTEQAGKPFGVFEFTTASSAFSGALTDGAALHIFQRTYGDSGTGTLSEAVSANNQERRVGTIYLSLANNTSQHVYREMFPVWPDGGKFVVRFSDGNSGSTITVTAGWKMDYRPTSYGVSSS